MWYVYILKDAGEKIYVGSTDNIKRRVMEHKKRKCLSTKSYENIRLEAYIAVRSEKTARNLEKYFKTGSGKAVLKKRILS